MRLFIFYKFILQNLQILPVYKFTAWITSLHIIQKFFAVTPQQIPPNLDCDTYFGDTPTLFTAQMTKVVNTNYYKITLTNKGTREDLTLYQDLDTLSALMTIQDKPSKGTSSLACDDEMFPWLTPFTVGGKDCSFHENLWPPINSQAV